MKYNENLYYYLPVKKFIPGGHSSTIFVIKDDTSKNDQYLVEGGINAGGWTKKIMKKMVDDGIDINQTNGILCTHAHQDHITGINFYLNQISGKNYPIPVYFHKDYVDILKDPKIADQYFFEQMGEYRKDLWGPQRIAGFIFNTLWGKRTKIDNVQGVNEGDSFPLGDKTVEVVLTEGHSPAHTSYLVNCSDGKKILLSGDLISFKEDDEGNLITFASLNNPASVFEAELRTLRKLISMDIDVLFSDHYGFYEGKDYINSLLNSALERIITLKNDIVMALTKNAMSIKELSKSLITEKHYLSGYAARTSTIFSILKHLIENGEVSGNPITRTFSKI